MDDLRILIIEDEAMVCMLIEDLVAEMGFSVAGTAAGIDAALASVSSLDFDAAILDVNLNGTKSYPVAEALKAKGIPFVMATGYGAAGVSDAYRDVPVIAKPFRQEYLEQALRDARGVQHKLGL